jgi:ATP-dependent exoDNAse (exonuclease V) beta subunit
MVFLERYELKVIEALLYVLDNPMQDIPLAGVLSSPLFECSLDEEEMLKIRIFGKGFKFFYECVQHYKENGDDGTIRQKIVDFYERISQIRESLLHSTVSELVENIFETSGLMSYAAAMPQGEDVIRSLEDFLEWVRSIDESRHSDLHSFVRLMQDIRQKSPDSSPFGAQESLSDSVKVITMHRSKGLEYEIVFLAGNNRQLSSKDTKAPILISEKMGIGFDYVNVLEQYKYPTPLVYAMKEEMRKEELAEEMRLFYVGMTRAKRRLYITGTYKSEEHKEKKGLADVDFRVNKYMDEYINSTNKGWNSFKLPPHIVLGVKNTLEWVFMSIAGNPEIDMRVFDINTSDPENDAEMINQSYDGHDNDANDISSNTDNNSCDRISRGRVWSLRSVNYEDSIINAQKILAEASLIKDTNMVSESSRQGILEQDSEKPSENINTTETKNQMSAYATTPLEILESFAKNDNEERDVKASDNEIIESNVTKAIRNKFFYEYPNARATSTPLKISVSEIKRQQQKEEELAEGTVNVFSKDSNLETTDSKGQNIRGINTTVHKIADNDGKALTSPQIGIAVHNFFRYANLDAIMVSPDEKTLFQQLRIMEGMNMFTKEEAFELEKSIPAFQAYYTSDLAQKIYAKQKENRSKVFREIPFTLKLACSEVFADKSFDAADFTFVQGIIDCWYEEDGKAVLIDYKTDHIRGSEEEIRDILQKRYQSQITVYAKAIRDIKGLDVKESIIWLFNSKKQFTIKEAPDGIHLV